MKLIKLTDDHYIVVDDLDLKKDDWCYRDTNIVLQVTQELLDYYSSIKSTSKHNAYKITHSTQPIEEWKSVNYGGDGTVKKKIYNKIKELPLQEVKELLGEVDTEQYAWDNPILSRKDVYELFNDVFKDKHIEGAYKISASKQVHQFNHKLRELAKQRALEDNKEKKYTEEDMINWTMCMIAQYAHGNTNIWNKDLLRESLPKPKTEWDVEFVDGKIKLKQ